MTGPDIEALRERFLAYAEAFATREPGQEAHYRLKIEHSLRVLALAQEIARQERLDTDTAELTAMAALFHDTGRFPQLRQYRTFSDQLSENHARLGVRALLENGLLEGLVPVQRRVILGAVFLHNARSLPERLPEPLSAVTRAVRDADKLDIIPLLLEHLENAPVLDPVVCLGVTRDPVRYSPALLEDLEQGRLASYSQIRYENDLRLLAAGWTYDLNYPASRRIFIRQGLLERLFRTLPPEERLLRLRLRIEADLQKS